MVVHSSISLNSWGNVLRVSQFFIYYSKSLHFKCSAMMYSTSHNIKLIAALEIRIKGGIQAVFKTCYKTIIPKSYNPERRNCYISIVSYSECTRRIIFETLIYVQGWFILPKNIVIRFRAWNSGTLISFKLKYQCPYGF